MEWLHTWSGRSFGYRDGDDLRTHDGRHVGKFQGDEIFDKNGKYLGELCDGRLITSKSKKSIRGGEFYSLCKNVCSCQLC